MRKAGQGQRRLRMGLLGAPGVGKSSSAVRIADALAGGLGLTWAMVDTEQVVDGGCASDKLVDVTFRDGEEEVTIHPFDVEPLAVVSGDSLTKACRALHQKEGKGVLVVDSVSAEWEDVEVREAAAGGVFTKGGREAKVAHRRWVQELLDLPVHLILTARTKNRFQEQEQPNGKRAMVRVGVEARQSDDFAYELDLEVLVVQAPGPVVTFEVRKSRVTGLTVGMEVSFHQLVELIRAWLAPERERLLSQARSLYFDQAKHHNCDLRDAEAASELRLVLFGRRDLPSDLTTHDLREAVLHAERHDPELTMTRRAS